MISFLRAGEGRVAHTRTTAKTEGETPKNHIPPACSPADTTPPSNSFTPASGRQSQWSDNNNNIKEAKRKEAEKNTSCLHLSPHFRAGFCGGGFASPLDTGHGGVSHAPQCEAMDEAQQAAAAAKELTWSWTQYPETRVEVMQQSPQEQPVHTTTTTKHLLTLHTGRTHGHPPCLHLRSPPHAH